MKQLFKVRLSDKPKTLRPDCFVDGYLGMNNEVLTYTRGEAIKKARAWRGKIEATDEYRTYDHSSLQISLNHHLVDYDGEPDVLNNLDNYTRWYPFEGIPSEEFKQSVVVLAEAIYERYA